MKENMFFLKIDAERKENGLFNQIVKSACICSPTNNNNGSNLDFIMNAVINEKEIMKRISAEINEEMEKITITLEETDKGYHAINQKSFRIIPMGYAPLKGFQLKHEINGRYLFDYSWEKDEDRMDKSAIVKELKNAFHGYYMEIVEHAKNNITG